MAKFVRTEEMEYKMTIDSFGGNVEMDLLVEIHGGYYGSKMKAYSPKLGCYLQFPKALRKPNAKFICDAAQSQKPDGKTFYRAYKGTIRDRQNNVVG